MCHCCEFSEVRRPTCIESNEITPNNAYFDNEDNEIFTESKHELCSKHPIVKGTYHDNKNDMKLTVSLMQMYML